MEDLHPIRSVPEDDPRFRAIQQNFDTVSSNLKGLHNKIKATEEEVPADEFDEPDPNQVTGARFHAFWREKHHGDIKWYAEGRWDELLTADFPVTRYKVRLWRWDPGATPPGTIPAGMPGVHPSGGYVKTYPVGHAKAGEYMPPRVKDIKGKDDDANTFAKTEWSGLVRKATYVMDVRAFGVNKKGPWSELSAQGTALDTTAPPPPTSVFLDVDQHRAHIDPAQPVDPDDSDRIHPDIAYTQYKVTTDLAGNNVVTLPSGRELRDTYAASGKKTFRLKRPSGNYYGHARNVDGSGNKSAWVTSPAGSKGIPPTPAAAPTVVFTKGTKPGNLRMDITFTYGGVFTDDFIDAFIVRIVIDGKTMWRRVDVDEGSETGSYALSLRGVDVGDAYDVSYRAKAKKTKSALSASASGTAYEVITTPTPTTPTITQKKHSLIARWTNPIARESIRHWEIEWYNASNSLIDWDYHVMKMRDSLPRKKAEGAAWARVRYVTVNGTASSWSANQIGVAPEGTKGDDIDTATAKLDTTFFYGNAYGDLVGGTGLSSIGDVSAGTIIGALIATGQSSAARVELNGLTDALTIHGSGGTKRGALFADVGDFWVKSYNSADIKLDPAGRVHFIVSSIPGTGTDTGTFLNIRVNGTDYKLKLFT